MVTAQGAVMQAARRWRLGLRRLGASLVHVGLRLMLWSLLGVLWIWWACTRRPHDTLLQWLGMHDED